MERLRKQAREKLIGKLRPSQQKKAEELLGDDFEFKKETNGSIYIILKRTICFNLFFIKVRIL